MDDNIRNEVVTIHRSQEELKMLPLCIKISFSINFSLKSTGTTILALQHTRQQLSLNGAGLSGLDVDSLKSSSDYFGIYVSLQVKPLYIRKEYQLWIDLTFDDRL
jgi:hypothetical protein